MAAELKLTVTPVADSADIAANTSRVKIVLKITTADGTYNLTGSTSGSLTLDGKQIASLKGKKVEKNTTTTLYSGTHTVTHQADGTRTVLVEAAFDVETSVRWIYAEKSVTLPPIPRSSTLLVPLLTLGQAAALTIAAMDEGFTHRVLYALGEASGEAVAETASLTPEWTPPAALAAQIPYSTSAEGTLTLITLAEGVEIGRQTTAATFRVGADMVPAVALTVTVDNGDVLPEGWTMPVKGRSRLRYQMTATPGEGAAISRAVFTFGQQSAEGTEGFLIPARAGCFAPIASLTDSRGRTAEAVWPAMDVYDYVPPAVAEAAAWRSDGQGQPCDDGSFAAVRLQASCSSVGGHNRLQLQCRFRPTGGSWSGSTPLTNGEMTVLPGLDPMVSYEVELTAADTVGEAKQVVCPIPTAAVAFVLAEGGGGAGFGKYPERAGLDMAWPIHMNGYPITGLPEPVSDSDAAPWGQVNFDRIYPVGSIYLTVADVDPAALFGGTWQRIRDTFLLAAGDTYAAGSTGGEAAHTLTEAEIPSHSHTSHDITVEKTEGSWVVMRSVGFSDQDDTRVSRTAESGGDQPHNNMPPYLAVNVWQRTA